MCITDIQKTKKGKYALFIDGEFSFSVTAEQMVVDKIKKNMIISSDQLAYIFNKSQEIFAKEKAISILSRKSCTKKNLVNKLCEYVSDEIANSTADRMEEVGLIDDEDYARRLCSDCYKLKKYGRIRTTQILIEKGVAKEIANNIATEMEPDQDDKENIIKDFIQKKYARQLLSCEDKQEFYKLQNKIQAKFVRMGYNFSEINFAIKLFCEENQIYF